jgi:hypothetical protein
LRHPDAEAFSDGIHKRQLVFSPVTQPIRLMDTQHSTKKPFDDQGIVNLRTKIYSAGVFSNCGAEISWTFLMV